MRQLVFALFSALIFIPSLYSQEREYSFVIVDSPAKLYTMRQSNENYLSAYRLGVCELNETVSYNASLLVQVFASLLFVPLTHEEGHRSVLTDEKVGSISVPYLNKHLAAYVVGVRDAELQNLRDTKLPSYIRLHTGGVESDYALSLRSNSLLSWNMESMNVLYMEYVVRKVSMVGYYAMGLFKVDAGITEEADELDRDIVGHDIYGAIRHLHRPGMEFYRYTNYDDLTSVEQQFVKRVGWRSLINLADPVLFFKNGFTFHNGNKFNFALGYGMAPFGDYIDQQCWLKINQFNTRFYVREYENKNTWFPAAGIGIGNLQFYKWLLADVMLHGWQQPRDLDFNTTQGRWGGAVDAMVKFRFYSKKKENIGLSLNLGITAKTQGFLLEEAYLDNHVNFRFGASLWLK